MLIINTGTKIINIVEGEGKAFQTPNKDGKTTRDLTVGDVLVSEVNRSSDLELKETWELMGLLSRHESEISLRPDQIVTLTNLITKSAKLPIDERYHIAVYGQVYDLLNKVETK